jgi:CheY-like chemotaxis protein
MDAETEALLTRGKCLPIQLVLAQDAHPSRRLRMSLRSEPALARPPRRRAGRICFSAPTTNLRVPQVRLYSALFRSLRKTMPHILSVSYDEVLLNSRQLVLESEGYRVTSAWGFQAALQACQVGKFDLFVLGHSIPTADKEALIKEFRAHCSALVIALARINEPKVRGADYQSETDPKMLVALIDRILSGKERRADKGLR